jgi:hypothetical protein
MMSMGLEDRGHAKFPRKCQEVLMLVSGIDQDCLAALATPQDIDIVGQRPHHGVVDLAEGVFVDQITVEHPLRFSHEKGSCQALNLLFWKRWAVM